MIDIECTRCGATGSDYPTHYVAKFSLTHNTGCGAKVGVPKYTDSDVKTTLKQVTILTEPKEKPKKKKSSPKKKKVEE